MTRTQRIATAIALTLAFSLGFFGGPLFDRLPWAPPQPSDTISEDDPRWNCLTMGNGVCGPDYRPVDAELSDALSEGEVAKDYTSCLVREGDTTYIVCPDGQVLIS